MDSIKGKIVAGEEDEDDDITTPITVQTTVSAPAVVMVTKPLVVDRELSAVIINDCHAATAGCVTWTTARLKQTSSEVSKAIQAMQVIIIFVLCYIRI